MMGLDDSDEINNVLREAMNNAVDDFFKKFPQYWWREMTLKIGTDGCNVIDINYIRSYEINFN